MDSNTCSALQLTQREFNLKLYLTKRNLRWLLERLPQNPCRGKLGKIKLQKISVRRSCSWFSQSDQACTTLTSFEGRTPQSKLISISSCPISDARYGVNTLSNDQPWRCKIDANKTADRKYYNKPASVVKQHLLHGYSWVESIIYSKSRL